jgi:hypothetical protein
VSLEDIRKRKLKQLKQKAERVRDYKDPHEEQKLLMRQFEKFFVHGGKRISIKHIAQHYYLPVVLSKDGKADYIRHIIKTESEVKFIKDLEAYLSQPNKGFQQFDWWFFSKLDESLDEVYIPYYDPKTNRMARFKPDFIFWLCKDSRYWIVFVDPKGTEHVDYQRKIEGYREVFCENGKPRVFHHCGKDVTVHLFIAVQDVSRVPEEYRAFAFDKVETLIGKLLEESLCQSPSQSL